MKKRDILIILGMILITLSLMLHPVKVGDVIEDDKGNSYFYTGDGYIEIVTKEHHQKLIEKYLKK